MLDDRLRCALLISQPLISLERHHYGSTECTRVGKMLVFSMQEFVNEFAQIAEHLSGFRLQLY